MPSPDKPFRICVIGDSQIGSVREAHDMGLIHWPDGAHVEFWGAPGPQFRNIQWQKGAIRAKGDVRDTVLAVNGAGRDHVAADDFDLVLFYGARLRAVEFIAPMLQWQIRAQAPASSAALQEAANSFLICTRAWRMAGDLARDGAKVMYFPSAFPTAEVVTHKGTGGLLEAYPEAERAERPGRDRLWSAMCHVAGQDGVTLVPQPDHTIVQGVLTSADYACRDAVEKRDFGHKSAEFAALWVNEGLTGLQEDKAAA